MKWPPVITEAQHFTTFAHCLSLHPPAQLLPTDEFPALFAPGPPYRVCHSGFGPGPRVISRYGTWHLFHETHSTHLCFPDGFEYVLNAQTPRLSLIRVSRDFHPQSQYICTPFSTYIGRCSIYIPLICTSNLDTRWPVASLSR